MIQVAFAEGSNTRLVVVWKDEPAEKPITPEAYERAPDLLFSVLGIGPQKADAVAAPKMPRRPRRVAQSTQSSPESR